jgi:hypothetical protein
MTRESTGTRKKSMRLLFRKKNVVGQNSEIGSNDWAELLFRGITY